MRFNRFIRLRSRLGALGGFAVRVAVMATVALAANSAQAQTEYVHVWETYTDQTRLLAPGRPVHFGVAAKPANIDVDPSKRYQSMVGFGANITDASAWLIQHKLSSAQRETLLQDLFGKPPGIGLSFTRLTIGASDFSMRHYSLDDMPKGQTDESLSHFSIEPLRADVLPVVKSALAINPQLKVMASPWSAPGWMKTNDSLIQGALRPQAYDAFARYLGKFADAMEAEGVPLYALTLQNEPHFEPKDYPGMRLDSAARAQVVAKYLGPLLQQRAQSVRILDWDHNWDQPQAPQDVLSNPDAARYVAGVAWHCYAGEVSAQNLVHDAYPDKETYFTECSGGEWKPYWDETLPWYMHNLIIGTTRGWAKGVLLWNIALDEKFGPHLGGCNDCRGVVTIHSKTGAITRNFDYYALAHVSRFVRPGAVRIDSSTGVDRLESVAFQNSDDGSLVLVVLNPTAHQREFSVSVQGRRFAHRLPGASVATFVWNGKR